MTMTMSMSHHQMCIHGNESVRAIRPRDISITIARWGGGPGTRAAGYLSGHTPDRGRGCFDVLALSSAVDEQVASEDVSVACLVAHSRSCLVLFKECETSNQVRAARQYKKELLCDSEP